MTLDAVRMQTKQTADDDTQEWLRSVMSVDSAGALRHAPQALRKLAASLPSGVDRASLRPPLSPASQQRLSRRITHTGHGGGLEVRPGCSTLGMLAIHAWAPVHALSL